MAQNYKVTATQPWTFLDQNNRVIDGFKVFYFMPEVNENHFVMVSTLDPAAVKAAIETQVKQRKDLSTL